MEPFLAHLFSSVSEALSSFAKRQSEARDRQRELILASLDFLKDLCRLHVEAINAVVNPIVQSGDISETHELLWKLVNNPDFPTGYDEAKGILTAALDLRQFRGGTVDDNPVKSVLERVTNLQHACFLRGRTNGRPTIKYYSWDMTEGFSAAVELQQLIEGELGLRSGEVTTLKERMQQTFGQDFGFEIEDSPISSDIEEAQNAQDVMRVVEKWCKGWQRHVQRTLYNHVARSISSLEMAIAGMR
jgi:hypothetical protein